MTVAVILTVSKPDKGQDAREGQVTMNRLSLAEMQFRTIYTTELLEWIFFSHCECF